MVSETALELKKIQAVEAGLDSLDAQKGTLQVLASQIGLNPIRDQAKNIVLGKKMSMNFLSNLKSAVMEKLHLGYTQQELLDLQNKVANAPAEEQLDSLIKQFTQKDGDPIKKETPQNQSTQQNAPATPEDVDKYFNDADNRDKVGAQMDKVLTKKIKYRMGARNGDRGYLDCSGLIHYILEKAGFSVPVLTSREIFSNKTIVPQKIEMEDAKIKRTSGVEGIKEGDVIFWNATNKKYQRTGGGLSNIQRDGKSYRIHHVAFVKSINFDAGTITVVESSPDKGVHESIIDPKEVREKTKHKSDLYVAHVDYSNPQNIFGQEKDPSTAVT